MLQYTSLAFLTGKPVLNPAADKLLDGCSEKHPTEFLIGWQQINERNTISRHFRSLR